MKVGSFSSNNDSGIFKIVAVVEKSQDHILLILSTTVVHNILLIFSTTVVHMPTKEVTVSKLSKNQFNILLTFIMIYSP